MDQCRAIIIRCFKANYPLSDVTEEPRGSFDKEPHYEQQPRIDSEPLWTRT